MIQQQCLASDKPHCSCPSVSTFVDSRISGGPCGHTSMFPAAICSVKSLAAYCEASVCTQLFLFYHAFRFFAIKKVDRNCFSVTVQPSLPAANPIQNILSKRNAAVIQQTAALSQPSCFTLSDIIDSTSSFLTFSAAASSRNRKSSASRK